jgi:NAD-dependent SIR2 family protein deacetylase
MFSPALLMRLAKFAAIKSSDVTVPIVKEVCDVLKLQVRDEVLNELVNAVQTGNADTLAEWAGTPENLAKLKGLKDQHKETTLVECPHCLELSHYELDEIPVAKPFVICRSCNEVVQFGENSNVK